MADSIKKNPKNSNLTTSSIKKSSTDITKSDPNQSKSPFLTTSLKMSTNTNKNPDPMPEINKPKSAYPSELKTLDILAGKTQIKLNKIQIDTYGFFREVGMNIYEVLSFGYIENLLKLNSIDYIATVIDMMKMPAYHVLTNPELLTRNRKISKEINQKYLWAQNSLISLFEGYLDILLNDSSRRLEVIYDFYAKCAKNEEIKFACNAFIRGFVAGFCIQNKRLIHENYKIFNLEENNAIISDFDLITYSTDLMIDWYEAMKNMELKALKRYKYGIDGQPNGTIKIINYGYNYYLLYEKDQQPLLERNILKENLIFFKKPGKNEINDKKNEKDEKRPSNKQEKPEDKLYIQSLISENKKDSNSALLRQKEEKKLNNLDEIIESCDKCSKKVHKKPLFSMQGCKHKICFDCMVKSYYPDIRYHTEFHMCPFSTCTQKFMEDDLQEYFSQIQINESITMSTFPKSQLEDKDLKKKETFNESEASVINLEPTVKCCLCHKNTPQSEIFTNPECYHCFCYECSSNKLNHFKSFNLCPNVLCHKYIVQKALEKFFNDFLSRDAKKNLIEITQQCYNCPKTVKISMKIGADFDFFQCKACKVTSCLIHCAPLNNCFCYCENCNLKTEADWMKVSCRYCPNCKRKFCLICKDSITNCECYCKVCESLLIDEKDRIYCKNCDDICQVCGVKTNARNKLIGLKCGHTYCRSCVFEKMSDFAKDLCLKKKTY